MQTLAIKNLQRNLARPIGARVSLADRASARAYGRRMAAWLALTVDARRKAADIALAWERAGNGVTPYLENSPETYGQEARIAARYGGTYAAGGADEAPDNSLAENSPLYAAGEALAARDAARA